MFEEKELKRLYEEGHTLEELLALFGDSEELRDIYVNSALMRKDFETIRSAIIEKIRNNIVRNCRNMVRTSPDKNMRPENEDLVIGYIYEEDGTYKKYYVFANPENIAKFIYSSDKEKFITSTNDYALMNTMYGTYLDLSCAHASYTAEVVKYLTKFQRNQEYQTFQHSGV